MALIQTPHAKRQEGTPQPFSSGVVMHASFKQDFTTQAFDTSADKGEFGLLPANAKLISATLIGTGLGAITADVGLLAGEPGANDDTRELTADLFDDESVNNATANSTVALMDAVGRSGSDRALGYDLSADVVAGAGKSLELIIQYVM